MKDHILVVGGYGHVGRLICQQLGNLYPDKVIAAGRSFSKAREFCSTTNGSVIPLELDITKSLPSDLFETVRIVVMCLDQKDTGFIQACFANNVDYIDISANHSFLSRIEELQTEAMNHKTAAVLSVGLAPGLTNLLARHTKSYLDNTEEMDIYVMLGLGDRHGRAAIEWTIDNLNTRFQVYSNWKKVNVDTFSSGKTTYFGKELGERKGYRFYFSDQNSLPHTLQIPTVSTRLCFDSKVITYVIMLLKRVGIFRLIKYQSIRKVMVWLFSKIRWGKELYALKIDAFGEVSGKRVKAECSIQGRQEALLTAKIAAKLTEKLYTMKGLNGIYHLEELFDIDSFYPDVIAPHVRITEYRNNS